MWAVFKTESENRSINLKFCCDFYAEDTTLYFDDKFHAVEFDSAAEASRAESIIIDGLNGGARVVFIDRGVTDVGEI